MGTDEVSAMASFKPCAVALLGCSLVVLSHASLEGKEFKFTYKGHLRQMATEMPSNNLEVNFRSIVRIQKADEHRYALKIERLEMAFNNSQEPKKWTRSEYDGLNFETNSRLTSMVERPFIMQFVENKTEPGSYKFDQMEVPALDPLWSVNLKKGLASLVNVYLPNTPTRSYVSHESTILGNCNTVWSAEHRPDQSKPSAKALRLTRQINFDQCSRVPYKVYGSLKATACSSCDEMKTRPLESMSKTEYSFVSESGDASEMVLEKAFAYSKLEHAPYTENGNVVKLLTEQVLQLDSVKDIEEKLEITGDKQVYQHLNMEIEKDLSIARKVDMKASPEFTEDWGIVAPEESAKSAMRELANHAFLDEQERLKAHGTNTSSMLFNQATTAMQGLNYEQTSNIFKAVVASAPEDKKLKMQQLFVEVTAASGQNGGILFLVEKFTSGEIDTRFVDSFLKAFHTGLHDITLTALNTVLDFCKSDLMRKFDTERNECLLIYTSLLSEACRLPNAAPQFNTIECSDEILQKKAFRELIPDYEVAKKDISQFRVFINMAANLGTEEAVEFLLKIINDDAVCNMKKLDAAHGLMRVLPRHRDLIQQQALAIYLDRQRPTDIRIMSSIMFFKSMPALSLLQSAARGLPSEPDHQVRSYVISMIKEIDSSDYPCFRAIRQNVRYIAPWIAFKFPSEWKRKDYLTSHLKLRTTYDPKFDQGSHSMYSMVMGDSYIPREISFSFGQYFANFLFESFSITARQKGMDSLVDSVFSPRNMGTKMGSNLWRVGGARRLTRSAESVKQKMDEINSKMNIKTKNYHEPRLDLTFGAFGHTLSVLSLNESHFAPFTQPFPVRGSILGHVLSENENKIYHTNLRDFLLVLPTSIGFLAWIEVKMPTAVSYKRQNSSFEMDNSGTMKLKLNQHLTVDSTLLESVGFDVPPFGRFLSIGFDKNVRMNLPLNVDVDWSIPNGKLTFNEEISLPRDFLRYSFKPYTELVGTKNDSRLSLFKPEEIEKFEKVVPLGGVNLSLKGSTLPNDPFCPKHILAWIFDHKLSEKINELLYNPKWIPRELGISFEQAGSFILKGKTLSIKHKMTPPSWPEKPKSLFAEHKEDLADSFTHVVQISKILRGDSDIQSDLEIRYSYTARRDRQWFHLFFNGKSLDNEQWKMCWLSKMQRTGTDWSKRSAAEIDKIHAGQKMQILTDINFGKECDAASTIHFNMTYEHSEQQKQWLDELKSGTSKTRVHGLENPYMRNYQNCVRWLSKGLVLPYACHKFMVHTSQLNQLTLEITGTDSMKLEDSPFITGAPGFMVSKLGQHLSSIHHLPSPQNRILIKSVVHEPCIDQRVADVELNALHYKLRFDDLPVSWGAHWAPRTVNHMGATNLQSYSRRFYNRYCDLQLNSVRTFDNVYVKIPESTCWKIVAEDCSEQKLFMLLTKTTSNGNFDIKLLLNTHEIEINNVDNGYNLKVDGADVGKLSDEEPKVTKNERGHLEFVVVQSGPVVTINAPIYGLFIVGHSSSIFVQAAPFYRGKLCGLCGNFDLNGQNDLWTTDGCHHHTDWSFAQNFVIPDDQCNLPAKANITERTNCT
uniref:Vitellogenin n=1 Tax=Neoseiulus barkeri TaxID=573039 RepID=A0A1Z2X6Q7_9ACAR|nr:vitellogenin [Neoseiulus barkeri]